MNELATKYNPADVEENKNIIKISIVPIIMIIIGNIILKYVVVKNLWILMLLGIIYVIIFGIF